MWVCRTLGREMKKTLRKKQAAYNIFFILGHEDAGDATISYKDLIYVRRLKSAEWMCGIFWFDWFVYLLTDCKAEPGWRDICNTTLFADKGAFMLFRMQPWLSLDVCVQQPCFQNHWQPEDTNSSVQNELMPLSRCGKILNKTHQRAEVWRVQVQ